MAPGKEEDKTNENDNTRRKFKWDSKVVARIENLNQAAAAKQFKQTTFSAPNKSPIYQVKNRINKYAANVEGAQIFSSGGNRTENVNLYEKRNPYTRREQGSIRKLNEAKNKSIELVQKKEKVAYFPPTRVFSTGEKLTVSGVVYCINEKISEGLLSTVYLVTAIEEKRKYVLKHTNVIDSVSQERLENEIKYLNLFKNNPRFAQLNSVEMEGKSAYIILEYYEGSGKLERVGSKDSIENKEVEILENFQKICEILEYMHDLSPALIHINLITGNIFEVGNGNYVLAGLGNVKTSEECEAIMSFEELQQFKDRVRTFLPLEYCPPELVNRDSSVQIGKQADVWLLGTLLYGMSFGKSPFQGISEFEILNAQYVIPKESGYSKGFINLFQLMLREDPRERASVKKIRENVAEMLVSTILAKGKSQDVQGNVSDERIGLNKFYKKRNEATESREKRQRGKFKAKSRLELNEKRTQKQQHLYEEDNVYTTSSKEDFDSGVEFKSNEEIQCKEEQKDQQLAAESVKDENVSETVEMSQIDDEKWKMDKDDTYSQDAKILKEMISDSAKRSVFGSVRRKSTHKRKKHSEQRQHNNNEYEREVEDMYTAEEFLKVLVDNDEVDEDRSVNYQDSTNQVEDQEQDERSEESIPEITVDDELFMKSVSSTKEKEEEKEEVMVVVEEENKEREAIVPVKENTKENNQEVYELQENSDKAKCEAENSVREELGGDETVEIMQRQVAVKKIFEAESKDTVKQAASKNEKIHEKIHKPEGVHEKYEMHELEEVCVVVTEKNQDDIGKLVLAPEVQDNERDQSKSDEKQQFQDSVEEDNGDVIVKHATDGVLNASLEEPVTEPEPETLKNTFNDKNVERRNFVDGGDNIIENKNANNETVVYTKRMEKNLLDSATTRESDKTKKDEISAGIEIELIQQEASLAETKGEKYGIEEEILIPAQLRSGMEKKQGEPEKEGVTEETKTIGELMASEVPEIFNKPIPRPRKAEKTNRNNKDVVSKYFMLNTALDMVLASADLDPTRPLTGIFDDDFIIAKRTFAEHHRRSIIQQSKGPLSPTIGKRPILNANSNSSTGISGLKKTSFSGRYANGQYGNMGSSQSTIAEENSTFDQPDKECTDIRKLGGEQTKQLEQQQQDESKADTDDVDMEEILRKMEEYNNMLEQSSHSVLSLSPTSNNTYSNSSSGRSTDKHSSSSSSRNSTNSIAARENKLQKIVPVSTDISGNERLIKEIEGESTPDEFQSLLKKMDEYNKVVMESKSRYNKRLSRALLHTQDGMIQSFFPSNDTMPALGPSKLGQNTNGSESRRVERGTAVKEVGKFSGFGNLYGPGASREIQVKPVKKNEVYSSSNQQQLDAMLKNMEMYNSALQRIQKRAENKEKAKYEQALELVNKLEVQNTTILKRQNPLIPSGSAVEPHRRPSAMPDLKLNDSLKKLLLAKTTKTFISRDKRYQKPPSLEPNFKTSTQSPLSHPQPALQNNTDGRRNIPTISTASNTTMAAEKKSPSTTNPNGVNYKYHSGLPLPVIEEQPSLILETTVKEELIYSQSATNTKANTKPKSKKSTDLDISINTNIHDNNYGYDAISENESSSSIADFDLYQNFESDQSDFEDSTPYQHGDLGSINPISFSPISSTTTRSTRSHSQSYSRQSLAAGNDDIDLASSSLLFSKNLGSELFSDDHDDNPLSSSAIEIDNLLEEAHLLTNAFQLPASDDHGKDDVDTTALVDATTTTTTTTPTPLPLPLSPPKSSTSSTSVKPSTSLKPTNSTKHKKATSSTSADPPSQSLAENLSILSKKGTQNLKKSTFGANPTPGAFGSPIGSATNLTSFTPIVKSAESHNNQPSHPSHSPNSSSRHNKSFLGRSKSILTPARNSSDISRKNSISSTKPKPKKPMIQHLHMANNPNFNEDVTPSLEPRESCSADAATHSKKFYKFAMDDQVAPARSSTSHSNAARSPLDHASPAVTIATTSASITTKTNTRPSVDVYNDEQDSNPKKFNSSRLRRTIKKLPFFKS